MTFAQRFNAISSEASHLSDLEIDKPYPIERADRVKTRYGDTFLLSLRDTANDSLLRVFLPQRYVAAFKDDDIVGINERGVNWYLQSGGKCPTTGAYQLSIG